MIKLTETFKRYAYVATLFTLCIITIVIAHKLAERVGITTIETIPQALATEARIRRQADLERVLDACRAVTEAKVVLPKRVDWDWRHYDVRRELCQDDGQDCYHLSMLGSTRDVFDNEEGFQVTCYARANGRVIAHLLESGQ